jgi:MtfA peptidase
MEIAIQAILIIAVLALFLSLLMQQRKRTILLKPLPESYKAILEEQSVFYQQLDEERKNSFDKRVQHFLSVIKITGVNTEAEEIDKTLIAASAVIPIFGFPDWEYINLREVLLYPDSFNHDFEQTGSNRNVLGMVGTGALNNIMLLSKHELRQAFINKTGKTNTAIHEFVHLIDKTDGATDGIPEFILDKQYVLPWLQLMHQEIKKILADKSDINPYGATNEAEFFAVVSEYFFERPDLLKEKNPALYNLLTAIFRQQPAEKN